MLAKSDLDHLVETFDQPESFHGIILHGSCAKKTDDAASDIDLLCIKQAGPPEKRHAHSMGRDVDIYLSSPQLIKRAFMKAQSNNNNVILNAFVTGQILVDRTGIVARLMNDARAFWKKGPPPISPVRRRQRILLLMEEWRHLKRIVSRAPLPSISCEITRIVGDTIFRGAISLYCRINQRWASSLAETLKWLRQEDPGFYSLCEQYMRSAELLERAEKLELILGAVIASGPADST